jgi:hypothetical protein
VQKLYLSIGFFPGVPYPLLQKKDIFTKWWWTAKCVRVQSVAKKI